MAAEKLPLKWIGAGTNEDPRRAELPATPEGFYLAWASVEDYPDDETKEDFVHFEFLPIPQPVEPAPTPEA